MNTLGRSTNLKESRGTKRGTVNTITNTIESEKTADTSIAVSPSFTEPNELSPSEDEGANVDDVISPPVSLACMFCVYQSYGVDKNYCSFI